MSNSANNIMRRIKYILFIISLKTWRKNEKENPNYTFPFSSTYSYIDSTTSSISCCFTAASDKGAIRHEIYKRGYPYQSYFAVLQKEGDNESGNLYDVNWLDWKGETGQTPHLCYSKKASNGKYKVDCGTGP
ncbi:hypothetical protein B4067_1368 [Bacillus subtilis subsp. subtilis]|uniref:Uncharacterized protein n=1 Tax=Bacillus subtilis subsp. subtilis TaxID=135461 RepID=A0ABD3ZRQ5_BACIU|nr:hypothetical protein B4067_1368 [Bacillus subtilis subsp. subtilis]